MKKLLLTLTVLFIGVVLSACGNDEKDIEGYWSNESSDAHTTAYINDGKITVNVLPTLSSEDAESYSGTYEKKQKGVFKFTVKESKETSSDEAGAGEFKIINSKHLEIEGRIFEKIK
ncbi:hypothetical protein [Staphylococcus pseudintermedius]|uniref:hypothetical protein n=1 Tax=Staphylococcus pseudintermedius TaxID=283734 RepID=UPI001BDEF207|nr:hypothetical protein [Staphylococcus pseudintermedius]EJO7137804.1 hypothetical protein [Staphylococcus pseudintermedius]EJO7191153.1 hypothetical protein [Staphylococcus pseudintermedius]MDK3902707.1 hypothetical protein [Staphylococcus pseudintermedius]WQC57230.1 hypothetical protein U0485_08330 [Staphylococcus pseudintermedius]HDV6282909.1 hypothetical protein [Staphylococcus pseudintermedius]